MLAQGTRLPGEGMVVRDERARVTKCSEVLCRVEAEGGRSSDLAGAQVIPLRTVRLAGILHEPQVVALGQVGEPAHIGHLAVQVHRQDAPSARAHRRHRIGIEVVVALTHVDHDRTRTGLADGLERGDEGLGGDDYLVALPNASRNQSEAQTIEPARGANAFTCSAVRRERAFEAVDLMARW